MADLTALVLTKNEEINIRDCLESVRGFASRAVVVDSGSTDRTVEIARELGADIYVHPFENNARQLNWGIDHTGMDTKWILRLDADERFTPELCALLEEQMRVHADDDVNGFILEAWFYFLGKRLTHSGDTKRKLMVFKRGIGRIEDRKMDEHTILSSGRAIFLREKYLHYDFKDLNTYVSKLNWYATREMQDYFDFQSKAAEQNFSDGVIAKTRRFKFRVYYKFPMFLRCRLLFLLNYFIKGGFLDGREGYIFVYLYSYFYRMLVDAKIYEQKLFQRPFEETGPLK